MVQTLTREPAAYQWALPESLKVPADELEARLDFYHSSIVLYLVEKGIITTRVVSAQDIATAFLRTVPLNTGILPAGALWWQHGRYGEEVALWRGPRIWPVAVQLEAGKPPVRFKVPMPGLIFVCYPGRPPRVYAAKRRPTGPESLLFNAPLFNIYQDGTSCAGTNKYPDKVEEIPESFFLSFFTLHAMFEHRSKKHPDSLFTLWQELNGKKRYPLGDLMPLGKIKDVLK